jgi:hypothetical protein
VRYFTQEQRTTPGATTLFEHDREGIVAKRKRDPYRRGVKWWQIKNRAYTQADDGRGELLKVASGHVGHLPHSPLTHPSE